MGTARDSQEKPSDEGCSSMGRLHRVSLLLWLLLHSPYVYCGAVSPSVGFYSAIKISRLTKQRRLETLW